MDGAERFSEVVVECPAPPFRMAPEGVGSVADLRERWVRDQRFLATPRPAQLRPLLAGPLHTGPRALGQRLLLPSGARDRDVEHRLADRRRGVDPGLLEAAEAAAQARRWPSIVAPSSTEWNAETVVPVLYADGHPSHFAIDIPFAPTMADFVLA